MTMTRLRKLDPWAPPLLLMAVIFTLSAQPDLSSGLGLVDAIGRKFIHAGEYALLCALWFRALRTVTRWPASIAGAVAIAVAYSASDEYHQSFVHGRHASAVDVLIDLLGALLAAVLLARARRSARARVA
jgi:VanZ family protein